VLSQLRRAAAEIDEVNSSGGYMVAKSWNKEEKRAMKPAEVLEVIHRHCQKLARDLEKAKAGAGGKKPSGRR